jgi:hypothetical protein
MIYVLLWLLGVPLGLILLLVLLGIGRGSSRKGAGTGPCSHPDNPEDRDQRHQARVDLRPAVR